MRPTRPGPPVTDAPGPPFYGGPDTPVCKQIKKGGRFHFTNPHRPGQSSAQHGHERKKKKNGAPSPLRHPKPPAPTARCRGNVFLSSTKGTRRCRPTAPCRGPQETRQTPTAAPGRAPRTGRRGTPPQRRRPPARHLRALPGGDQAASWAARPCERTTGCLSLGTKSSRKALGSWGCAGGPHRTSSTRKPLKQAHTRRRLGKFGREQRSRGPRKGVTLSPPCPWSAFREEPVSEAVNGASQAEPQLLR